MLDALYRFQQNDKEWKLTLPIDSGWKQSDVRVLIILQSLDKRDLKAEGLLNDKLVRTAFHSALDFGRAYAKKHRAIPKAAYAVSNHQSYRHLHLKGHAQAEAEAEFRVRTLALITKLNPTHILFSGDLSLLYPIQNSNNKNGWVHKIDNRFVTSTLDFARLLEKDGAQANLLGFWCRHLAFLLLERNPFQVKLNKIKPTYIDTIARFDKVMRLFDKAKLVGVDTETKNLTVLHNAIYTIQFAFDTEPDRGFLIPVDHPHENNPFSKEERIYIKKELRKRFVQDRPDLPTLVTMNGMFDLRVIRRQLNLDIIYHKVWEVTAGEHLLDENISSMAGMGIKMGGLAAIFCMYGNDHYLNENTGFSKDDRNTAGNIDPGTPEFVEYGGMDVCSVLAIRESQLLRSEYEELDGKTYRPFFERHMLYQMSDTAHQLSHLRESGSMIDVKYLRSLMTSDSPLHKAIEELQDEFKTLPPVQKANQQLLDESGFKAASLFGGSSSQWIFSFTKPAHKIKLFLEILGLKELSTTKGGAPSIDKEFIDHYKDRNLIVAMFGDFQDASKILSTYVTGWYKRLRQELDGSDKHLRAEFEFFGVDTGRLASKKPNFQNIPARGKLSKVIKEMFISPDGHLLIRFDYSAHEVRGWSVVARDKVLAAAFKAGQELRKQWIKSPSDAVKKELKTKGDIHIQNCFRFFGKWVEKSDPIRDAVKGVVFGTLYGMSPTTLGQSTKKAELSELKAKLAVAYKSKSTDLPKLERQFNRLLEEDRTEYAQGIIDKMFAEFTRGHQWVLKMQHMAEEKFYVYSPIGRIRHLYAAMTKDKKIVSRQVRRGMNAPIQGFASEIAVKASRLTSVEYYRNLKTLKKLLQLEGDYPFRANRIVHDALYFTVPIPMAVPFIHMLQYTSTYGVADLYEKQFGLKFTVEPEIEMEFGVRDTTAQKWDWSLDNLTSILVQCIEEGLRDGLLTGDRDTLVKTLFEPWMNPKSRCYLQEKFPLLGVKDLDSEIETAVRKVVSDHF